jgi:simple sugar transport system substrate-binding protein
MQVFSKWLSWMSFAVALAMISSSQAQDVIFECDPCVERSEYTIKGIFHGTKDNDFWLQVQAAAVQSGKDMRVNFNVELYDTFDPDQMAQDIREAITAKPNALVLTIPSDTVAAAVSEAIAAGVPVFGLNSGYQLAKDLGVLGFVAQDEVLAGQEAAAQMLALAPSGVASPLYMNSEVGNSALDQRREGFEIGLNLSVPELQVDISDAAATQSAINDALAGCTYDCILLSSAVLMDYTVSALQTNNCVSNSTVLGTFDTNSVVYNQYR